MRKTLMKSQKRLVIINPSANSGNTQKIVSAAHEILRNEDTTFVETENAGHAIRLASKAENFDLVIAIGGDGTINEVVNGLMTIDEEKRPILAMIPCGSGNDSCRMAGIPLDVARALTIAITGTPKTFDIGVCNREYFLNSCSVGIDALVVAKTNELKATKKLSGTPLYASALMHIVLHDLKPFDVELSIDNNPMQKKKILLCAVTNGKTYGSGIAINPSADPTDGALSVVCIDEISVPKTLSYLPLLAAKKHEGIPEFHSANFEILTLVSPNGAQLIAQADGEIFSDTMFEIRTVPHALKIMVPAD